MNAPDREPAETVDLRRAAEDLLAAFQPLVEHILRVAEGVQPAFRQLADVCERVQRGELILEHGPSEHGCHCHCLCGMHKADGMFCAGDADGAIPLKGPYGLVVVPMCSPCAEWWLCRDAAELAGVG